MADFGLCLAIAAMTPFEKLSIGVQAAGAVILLAYTIYTARQVSALRESNETNRLALEATRDSNKATERSNEIAERAMVLGRRAWLIPEFGAADATMLTVRIVNYGEVPAVTIRYSVDAMWIAAIPERVVPDTKRYQARAMIIPPKKPAGMQLHARIAAVMTEEPNGRRLLAYCHVEYMDTFEKPFETMVCWWRSESTHEWFSEPTSSRLT